MADPLTRAKLATRQLPLSELTPYPKNPRRGDVAAIRESLERSGQYRALVVRSDTCSTSSSHPASGFAR